MYWFPKMYKTVTRAKFIVAYRKCGTKTLSETFTKAFQLFIKQIQSFHEKSHFYCDYKKSWVVENPKPVIDRLDQINTNRIQNLPLFLTLTPFTTRLIHKDLLKVLFGLIVLVEAQREKLIFPLNGFCRTSLKQNLFS